MIGFLTVFIIIFLIALEALSIWLSRRSIDVRCSVEHDLTQPGEPFEVTYEVRNRSLFPLLFCRLSFGLPQDVLICEDEKWHSSHETGTYLNVLTVRLSMSLKSRGCKTDTIRLCAEKRGVYDFGKCSVTTGDALGLFPHWEYFDKSTFIVCTAKKAVCPSLEARIGGRLGDVSVRRFLYDDPTLVMGFRDYTGHEPMKQISWLQTAKTGHLCVRVNDFTAQPSVAIFLDLGHGSSSDREHALERLRFVCEDLEKRKIQYSIFSNCPIGDVDSGYGEKHLHKVLSLIGRTSLVALYDSELLEDRMKSIPPECFAFLISSADEAEAQP